MNDTEKNRLGTRRGGRQGCRFGPDIFNAAYAAALQDVMNDIQKLGLFVCCSRFKKKLDFWSAGDVEPPHLGSPRPNEQRAGKVVYVDDLGLMLAAATPGALMKKLPAATVSGNIVRDTDCVSTTNLGRQRSCCTFLAKIMGN